MDGATVHGLIDVWGTSGSDMYAVGYLGTILHYDPAQMTTTTAPSSNTTTIPELCSIEQIYGEHSEQTQLLRYFRDNVLSKTPEGQEISKLYYEWSPAMVQAMEEDEAFKEEVRGVIDGVLGLIGGVE